MMRLACREDIRDKGFAYIFAWEASWKKTLKMETSGFSETSVSTYEST
jgi:hypothetical protein